MKKNSTLFSTFILCLTMSYHANAQIYAQNFNSSVVVTDYATSTNSSKKQLNFISNYGNSPSTIVDGKLQFEKKGASTSHFVRNLDFAPVPKLVKASFKFQCIDAIGDNTLNHAAFIFGSNFTNDANLPTLADTHSKFGITMDGGNFKLNVISNVANTSITQSSQLFSGQQTITFLVNNTGISQVYLAPDGSSESVANDTWDLWVGNTKVYNDINAYGNADIKNLRFSMLSATATINTVKVQFDDIEIDNLYDFMAWDFSGETTTITGAASPIINHANLEAAALNRGAGLTAGSFNHSYFSTYNAAIADKAAAISNGAFYSFSVKAKNDYKVSLAALNAKVRRNTTGPKKILWQYSVDGTNYTDLGTEVDLGTTSDGEVQAPIDLSGIAALQNVPFTTTITFRLLGWDASSGGGFAIGRITNGVAGNSLLVDGVVEAIPVLPVVLTSFKAVKQNSAVRLNWATSSEQDNGYFTVLRASEDKNFLPIGKINGNRSSTLDNNYLLTDYKPLAGANYYKLTQTDVNGKTNEIGEVQYVQFSLSNGSVQVLQNTGYNTVRAIVNTLKKENGTVSIYNMSGSSLYQSPIVLNEGVNELSLPVSLSLGVYILQVKRQGGKLLRTKFLK
ncbi:T9SS type A sorting domain-containing protein [Pedobacter sp. ASV28]|uniref:T9SS type A sorting domain-containing protein n=1 Tax=Pedobacter sp. ASV28 TaxID=2795123 RepID=UPI0018EB73D1|nr:T9SS type A sorting domain-containing protein [Pedobacter sp. ASV28]